MEYVLARTDWFSPLFDIVDFVLDSQQVVDSFHKGVDDHSEFGCIINVCRQLL